MDIASLPPLPPPQPHRPHPHHLPHLLRDNRRTTRVDIRHAQRHPQDPPRVDRVEAGDHAALLRHQAEQAAEDLRAAIGGDDEGRAGRRARGWHRDQAASAVTRLPAMIDWASASAVSCGGVPWAAARASTAARRRPMRGFTPRRRNSSGRRRERHHSPQAAYLHPSGTVVPISGRKTEL